MKRIKESLWKRYGRYLATGRSNDFFREWGPNPTATAICMRITESQRRAEWAFQLAQTGGCDIAWPWPYPIYDYDSPEWPGTWESMLQTIGYNVRYIAARSVVRIEAV